MFLQPPVDAGDAAGAPAVSPNLLRHIEQSAQSVAGLAGTVDPELLSAIVTAVDDYTIGYTLRELAAARPASAGAARGALRRRLDDPHVRYLLESGEFPLLAQFIGARRRRRRGRTSSSA